MMPRNTAFVSPGRPAPFDKQGGVHLDPKTVRGPLPFFNPTRARFRVEPEPKRPELLEKRPPATQVAVPQATVNWRSRDNRKGSLEFLWIYIFSLSRMCTKCGQKQADTPFKWNRPILSQLRPSVLSFMD